MAFPQKKKDDGPDQSQVGQEQAQGPTGGGVCPMCGMPMQGPPAGGAPPMGGGIPVRPGQGMDAMQAMSQGLGGQGHPTGPNGLPIGGQPPSPVDAFGGLTNPNMQGSDILSLLAGSNATQGMSGPLTQDLFGQPVGAPNTDLSTIGTQDPALGMEQILNMLALIKLGAAGSVTSSGLNQEAFDTAGFAQAVSPS